LHNAFSDAQCGFKALRADVARELLPLVEDQQWFFDTELLVQAERHGLRIHEVPVDWSDDPDSRVDIARTAIDDLKGVWRLLRNPGAGAVLGRPRGRSQWRRRGRTAFPAPTAARSTRARWRTGGVAPPRPVGHRGPPAGAASLGLSAPAGPDRSGSGPPPRGSPGENPSSRRRDGPGHASS